MSNISTATSKTNTSISKDAITATTSSAKDIAVPDKATILSETSAAYDAARRAMNAQIANVDARLQTTLGNLAKEFSAQQGQLNSQRNAASTSASLQAALTGGGFGGQAELAKRKYYSDSFVPAQTQLNTNLSTDRANARQQAEDSRLALQQALANIETQAATYGLQRYDSGYQYANTYNQNNAFQRDSLTEANKSRMIQYGSQQDSLEEAYKNRLLQQWQTEENNKTSIKAANISAAAARYLGGGSGGSSNGGSVKYVPSQNGSDWQYKNLQTGKPVRLGTFLTQYSGDFNTNLARQIAGMATSGDAYADQIYNEIKNGAKFTVNAGSSFKSTNNNVYDTLGIKRIN